MFKPYIKFERCRTIRGRVIDDFAHFRGPVLGGGGFRRTVLRGAWSELHQTWREHRAIIAALKFVSELRYLAAFSNAGGSNSTDVENDAKFRTF